MTSLITSVVHMAERLLCVQKLWHTHIRVSLWLDLHFTPRELGRDTIGEKEIEEHPF